MVAEARAEEARKPARERVLDTAAELFYREGIRAVGVDTIIARSGVAKMSLYRNFASKDELVCAYLDRLHQQLLAWWERVTARHPGDPRAQLKGLFVSLGHWVAHPRFVGCPFSSAINELREPDNPGRLRALGVKREVLERLSRLAAEAGAAEPDKLALQLQILMEGAYTAGQSLGPQAGPAIAAAGAALVDTALGGAQADTGARGGPAGR
ncbi:TetR/AcrR family transcriptional regulator [Azospirillum thermophilum]|uniref:TetR/AcrR family transcriptional regulator n=1 Tax=Azospirillum thermophilum TaxID=2202148 RepID=A0A2S2CU00_9PROT|nr:TetR/AcrR family transcriptional regulator [Azospirillum thermophilum]AWK87981.1 TetR/AcrR family transcriptional regulator [Azospirillum thermophilum]